MKIIAVQKNNYKIMRATLDYFRNLDNIHQPKWPREHKSVWFFPLKLWKLRGNYLWHMGVIFWIWKVILVLEKVFHPTVYCTGFQTLLHSRIHRGALKTADVQSHLRPQLRTLILSLLKKFPWFIDEKNDCQWVSPYK